jgi:pimeloyl-ACP methyl ester carboxylesterase
VSQVTGSLNVPGADLYYRCAGSGPPLLLIHGSAASADTYAPLADALASQYRVITYDRRGHARSRPACRAGGPGEPVDVARHAEDARQLLSQLAAEPAHVFGSSAGAVIALDLAARCAGALRTVVVHEPPAIALLPDAAELRAGYESVHRTYRSEGAGPAAAAFLAMSGSPVPPPVLARLTADFDAGFAAELLPVTGFVPDLPALRASTAALVPAAGSAPPVSPARRVAEILAASLGTELVRFPGNHFGYAAGGPGSDPAAFAARLAQTLG